MTPEDLAQIRMIVREELEALELRMRIPLTNAERQRRYRQRHRNENVTPIVTPALRNGAYEEKVTKSLRKATEEKEIPNGSHLPHTPSYSPLPSEKEDLKLCADQPIKPKRKPEREPKDWATFKEYAIKAGCKEEEATWLYATFRASNWTTNGKPIGDWKMKIISWHTAGYFEQQKAKQRR